MVIKTLQQLAIPDQKDCIFVSPDYKNWRHLLDENKNSLSKLDNTDISRSQLLSAALKYTQRFGLSVPHWKKHKSIIVTGHQPVWHHCGILAKNIITDRFARDTDGIPIHLVLDHDICGTVIVLPKYDRNGFLYFEKVQLEQRQQHIPLELRALPNQEQIRNFIGSFSKFGNSFCSSIWKKFSKQILNDIGSFGNVADFVTILQAILNQALGLEMIYLPVSLMSESKCFTDFVSSIICDAVKFTDIYNQGICNQMQTLNLNPAQTIRPLKIDLQKNVIELPFWLTFPTGRKFPLYVNLEGKNLSFGTAFNILGTLDSSSPEGKKQQLLEIMKTHNCRIRPKAVGLTLFVRLYLADWFVHGVGGGLYEQITDYVIRKYCKVMKLNFGVATATMTLSLEINNQNSHLTDVQLKSRLRELKFNPEKLIDRSILDKPPVKSLLNTKNGLIKTANNPQITASRRKDAWQKLSRINKELLGYTAQTHKKMLKETDLWRRHKTSKEITNCREFFFGFFREQKLKSLANLEEVENENSLNCCSPSR